jgi:hypothetical protein
MQIVEKFNREIGWLCTKRFSGDGYWISYKGSISFYFNLKDLKVHNFRGRELTIQETLIMIKAQRFINKNV